MELKKQFYNRIKKILPNYRKRMEYLVPMARFSDDQLRKDLTSTLLN